MLKRSTPKDDTELHELRSLGSALDAVQAIIWFDLDGKILRANDNFCRAMSVENGDIAGKHHSVFVDPREVETANYRAFWEGLRQGKAWQGDVARVDGRGRKVMLSAFYNPIRDSNGKLTKVVKFAVDVTAKRKTLRELSNALNGLSEGDLGVRLSRTNVSEYEDMVTQFNAAISKLEEMVRAVGQVSEGLAGETEEIAANAQDLADRGEAQAATLEETAASLEELSTAVQGTAGNAQEAAKSAKTASNNATAGADIVSQAISAMQEIKNGSGEISKIIEVIDAISFQTNLLALNAGIEAARAGDAGRGFAVVASEIRALAQRTAEAAKDISNLIISSNENVASGAQLVDQTGESLSKISEEIAQVVSNVEEISNATSEQADGIASVTQATSRVDIATQQNAALAEQSAQSASRLSAETARLRQSLSAFKTQTISRRGADGSGEAAMFRRTA